MSEIQTPPVRLAHFSDIHITSHPLGWAGRDWFNKRFLGWMNYQWLGRKYRFRTAEQTLGCLTRELHEWHPDRIVFSGDATALGFESEIARATTLLGVIKPDVLPGMAVPGNHDYYTTGVAASGLFERYFAPWQNGERIDGERYPFAQRAGHIWLIGVNSATGNRWGWDASGGVDAAQLDRLAKLLARLDPGPRILVTHYPICLASGKAERRTHGLRNLREVIQVAGEGGVCLWLHGHRHGSYHLACTDMAPFPAICAGSATQHGKWSYNRYTIRGHRLHALSRVFVASENAFRDERSFELTLCEPARRRADTSAT